MLTIPYFLHLCLAKNILYIDNHLRIAPHHLHSLLYPVANLIKKTNDHLSSIFYFNSFSYFNIFNFYFNKM